MQKYNHTLNEIITKAVVKIRAIDQDFMNHKPSPKKWSKKELIGHLIDSAYNNHQRFLRAINLPVLPFTGYDQDEWVRRNRYQDRELEEVITTWFMVNQHIGFLISEIPDEALNTHRCEHNLHKSSPDKFPEGSTISLSYLVWDYLAHMEYHLAQIIENYEAINKPFEHQIFIKL